jgi:hypothetical protein
MGRTKKTIRKASGYMWDYVKMTGLFPNFKKKDSKKKGGDRK